MANFDENITFDLTIDSRSDLETDDEIAEENQSNDDSDFLLTRSSESSKLQNQLHSVIAQVWGPLEHHGRIGQSLTIEELIGPDSLPIDLDRYNPDQPVFRLNGNEWHAWRTLSSALSGDLPDVRVLYGFELAGLEDEDSVETSSLFVRGRPDPVVVSRITLDRSTNNLSADIQTDGQEQQLVIDGSGNLVSLILKSSENSVDLSIDKEGQFLATLNGEPVDADWQLSFMIAAHESATLFRQKNGIPAPLDGEPESLFLARLKEYTGTSIDTNDSDRSATALSTEDSVSATTHSPASHLIVSETEDELVALYDDEESAGMSDGSVSEQQSDEVDTNFCDVDEPANTITHDDESEHQDEEVIDICDDESERSLELGNSDEQQPPLPLIAVPTVRSYDLASIDGWQFGNLFIPALESAQLPNQSIGRLQGLFGDLVSDEPARFTRAMSELSRMGPALLNPVEGGNLIQLLDQHRDNPLVVNRLRTVLDRVSRDCGMSLETRFSALGSSLASNGFGSHQGEAINQLIAEADLLASNPEARQLLLNNISLLDTQTDPILRNRFPIPGFFDRLQQARTELIAPQALPVMARLWAADALLSVNPPPPARELDQAPVIISRDADGRLTIIDSGAAQRRQEQMYQRSQLAAHELLQRAMELNTSVVNQDQFLRLFARAAGRQHETLMNEFVRLGGDSDRLAEIERNLAASLPIELPRDNQERDRVRGELREAIASDPAVVRNQNFLQVFAAVAGHEDANLQADFLRHGGNLVDVLRYSRQIAQRRTDNLWNSFMGADFSTSNLSLQERQNNIAAAPDSTTAVRLLSDHITHCVVANLAIDGPEATMARQGLTNVANNPEIHGRQSADAARDALARFDVYGMASQARDQLRATFINNIAEPPGALDMIVSTPVDQRQEGENGQAISWILQRYENARTAQERHAAMELLRDEVQNGNESALHPLRLLSTVDAGLRLVNTANRLQSAATEEESAQARREQQQALLDLAMMANARLREGETTSPAGQILDLLNQRPLLSMRPEDVSNARSQAVEQYAQRQEAAAQAFLAVITTTGTMQSLGTNNLAHLHRAQITSDASTTLGPLRNMASFAAVINGIERTAGSPSQLPDVLLQLSQFGSRHEGVGDIFTRLATCGNAETPLREHATALRDAIASGDRARIVEVLRHPLAVQALLTAIRPQAQRVDMLESLSSMDIQALAGGEAGVEQLFQQAERRRQESHRQADDLVGQYLLRDSISEQLRTDIANLLPEAGTVLNLEDVSPEVAERLRRALELNQLTPRASRLVRTLLDDGSLSAQACVDLHNALLIVGATRTSGALSDLHGLSRDNLHLVGTRFQIPLNRLNSVESVQQVHQSARQLISTLGQGAEGTSPALQNLVAHLETLRRLSLDSSHHQEAAAYVRALETGSGRTLADLITSLRDESPESVESIAHTVNGLVRHLPDGRDDLNQWRALRIIRELRHDSPPEVRRVVLEQLDQELEASREDGLLNQHAREWRAWLVTTDAIMRLSESSAVGSDPALARQAMETITREARAGNQYALHALANVLVGGTGNTQAVSDWLGRHAERSDRNMLVPNFQGIPDALRQELVDTAIGQIQDFAQEGLLTPEMASAAAIAYSHEPDSTTARCESYRAILEGGINSASTLAHTLDSLVESMRFGGENTAELADLYIPHLNHPNLANHFNHIRDAAIAGDAGCSTILAAITTGVADFNTQANPVSVLNIGTRNGGLVDEYRVTERNSIADRARQTILAIAADPTRRQGLIESLMHIHHLNGNSELRDHHCYLSTLGAVAGQLPADQVTPEIREVLRDGFRRALTSYEALIDVRRTHGNTIDYLQAEQEMRARVTRQYRSAIDGFVSMTPHWTSTDVALFAPSTITADLVEALRLRSDAVPPAVARQLAARLLDMAERDNLTIADLPPELQESNVPSDQRIFQHRLQCLRALGTLAPHLSQQQVARIGQFGTTARFNAGGDQPRTGDQLLSEIGIAESATNHRNYFRAECAGILMQVMARSASAPPDGPNGPRETAFAAFATCPWPMYSIYENGLGRGTIVPSERNTALREAMVQYYQGQPFRPELADQINEIVDGAQLPRPAAALIINMGLHRGRITDRTPSDPPNVFMLAEQIVRHYGGEQVLRNVSRNVEVVNSLPAHIRAQVMGWTSLPDGQKRDLGWVSEPPTDMQARIGWTSMNETQREAWRWQNARVSAQTVIGQMYNNALQGGAYRALLTDIPATLQTMSLHALSERNAVRDQIRTLDNQRGTNLSTLVTTTRQGVSFGTRVSNIFNNGVDQAWADNQQSLAQSFDQIRSQINLLQPTLQSNQQVLDQLHMGGRIARYTDLRNGGHTARARELAMDLWQENGVYLQQIAPEIWRDLTTSRNGTLVGSSILSQLHRRGQAHWDTIPAYNREGALTNPAINRTSMDQILGLANCSNATEPRGLLQLRSNGGSDLSHLRAYMMRAMHDDPALSHFATVAGDMSQQMDEFRQFLEAAREGHIFQGGLNVMRGQAQFLRQQMSRITPAHLSEMRERIGQMQSALSRMELSGSSTDAETIRQLREAITTYKNMHDMFNPDRRTNYDQSEVRDRHGNLINDDHGRPLIRNPYNELNSMLNDVIEGRVTEATLTNWLRENGPAIAATIVACALTVSACATFGLTAPLAVGACCAAAGLIAREVTNEVFYHVNNGGHTGWGPTQNHGARIANWSRQIARADYDHPLTMGEIFQSAGSNVILPYTGEFLRDWAAFIVGAGLGHLASDIGAGGQGSIREAFGAVFRPGPAGLQQAAVNAERLALMASGSSRASACLRQILSQGWREMLQSVRDTALETALEGTLTMSYESLSGRNLTPAEMGRMGEFGQFLFSFTVSTGVGMGIGYRAGRAQAQAHRIIEHGSLGPGNVFEYRLAHGASEADFRRFMAEEGYLLTQTSAGEWHVRAIGGSPDMPSIRLHNLERGTGDPPVRINDISLDPQRATTNSVTVDGTTVQIHPDGQRIIQNVRQCLEHLQSGNFVAAMDAATSSTGLPAGVRMEPTDVVVRLSDLQGTNGNSHLQTFLRDIAAVGQSPRVVGGDTTVNIPRAIVEVDGVRFNAVTGEIVSTGSHAPGSAHVTNARAHFDTLRTSETGRRIATETVVTAMEERTHIQQAALGNRAISSLYADWVLRNQSGSTEHMGSFSDGTAVNRGRRSLEQEMLFIFEQAGLSRQNIYELFGHNHTDVRTPIVDTYLSPAVRLQNNLTQFRDAPGSDQATRRSLLDSFNAIPDAAVRDSFVEQVFSGTRVPPLESVQAALAAANNLLALRTRNPALAGQILALPGDIRRSVIDPYLARPTLPNDTVFTRRLAMAEAYRAAQTSHPEVMRNVLSLHPDIQQNIVEPFFSNRTPTAQEIALVGDLAGRLSTLTSETARQFADRFASAFPNLSAQVNVMTMIRDRRITVEGLATVIAEPAVQTTLSEMSNVDRERTMNALRDGQVSYSTLSQILANPASTTTFRQLQEAVADGRRPGALLRQLFELPNAVWQELLPRFHGNSPSNEHLARLVTFFADPANSQRFANIPNQQARSLFVDATLQIARNRDLAPDRANSMVARMLENIAAQTDPQLAAENAFHHSRLAMAGDAELHWNLLNIENQVLRTGLVREASQGVGRDGNSVTSARVAEIVAAHRSSREMARVIESLLSSQGPPTERLSLIETVRAQELTSNELSNLDRALRSGALEPDMVSNIVQAQGSARATLLECAGSGAIRDGRLLTEVANHSDVGALAHALQTGNLDATQLARLINLESSNPLQAEHIRALLRANARDATAHPIRAHEISALVGDVEASFRRALEIPGEFHTEPALIAAQRQAMAVAARIPAGEARTALETFARERLPSLHGEHRDQFTALSRQLDWLTENLTRTPSNADLLNLARNFPSNATHVAAYMAGVRTRIPEGDFVVYLHGTDGNFARQLTEQRTGALQNREFCVALAMDTGRAYSMEGNNANNPAIVGIAVPRAVAEHIERLIRTNRIPSEELVMIDGNIYRLSEAVENFRARPEDLIPCRIGTEYRFPPDLQRMLQDAHFFQIDRNLP